MGGLERNLLVITFLKLLAVGAAIVVLTGIIWFARLTRGFNSEE